MLRTDVLGSLALVVIVTPRILTLVGFVANTVTLFSVTWVKSIANVVVKSTFTNVMSAGKSAVNHAAGRGLNIH